MAEYLKRLGYPTVTYFLSRPNKDKNITETAAHALALASVEYGDSVNARIIRGPSDNLKNTNDDSELLRSVVILATAGNEEANFLTRRSCARILLNCAAYVEAEAGSDDREYLDDSDEALFDDGSLCSRSSEEYGSDFEAADDSAGENSGEGGSNLRQSSADGFSSPLERMVSHGAVAHICAFLEKWGAGNEKKLPDPVIGPTLLLALTRLCRARLPPQAPNQREEGQQQQQSCGVFDPVCSAMVARPGAVEALVRIVEAGDVWWSESDFVDPTSNDPASAAADSIKNNSSSSISSSSNSNNTGSRNGLRGSNEAESKRGGRLSTAAKPMPSSSFYSEPPPPPPVSPEAQANSPLLLPRTTGLPPKSSAEVEGVRDWALFILLRCVSSSPLRRQPAPFWQPPQQQQQQQQQHQQQQRHVVEREKRAAETSRSSHHRRRFRSRDAGMKEDGADGDCSFQAPSSSSLSSAASGSLFPAPQHAAVEHLARCGGPAVLLALVLGTATTPSPRAAKASPLSTPVEPNNLPASSSFSSSSSSSSSSSVKKPSNRSGRGAQAPPSSSSSSTSSTTPPPPSSSSSSSTTPPPPPCPRVRFVAAKVLLQALSVAGVGSASLGPNTPPPATAPAATPEPMVAGSCRSGDGDGGGGGGGVRGGGGGGGSTGSGHQRSVIVKHGVREFARHFFKAALALHPAAQPSAAAARRFFPLLLANPPTPSPSLSSQTPQVDSEGSGRGDKVDRPAGNPHGDHGEDPFAVQRLALVVLHRALSGAGSSSGGATSSMSSVASTVLSERKRRGEAAAVGDRSGSSSNGNMNEAVERNSSGSSSSSSSSGNNRESRVRSRGEKGLAKNQAPNEEQKRGEGGEGQTASTLGGEAEGDSSDSHAKTAEETAKPSKFRSVVAAAAAQERQEQQEQRRLRKEQRQQQRTERGGSGSGSGSGSGGRQAAAAAAAGGAAAASEGMGRNVALDVCSRGVLPLLCWFLVHQDAPTRALAAALLGKLTDSPNNPSADRGRGGGGFGDLCRIPLLEQGCVPLLLTAVMHLSPSPSSALSDPPVASLALRILGDRLAVSLLGAPREPRSLPRTFPPLPLPPSSSGYGNGDGGDDLESLKQSETGNEVAAAAAAEAALAPAAERGSGEEEAAREAGLLQRTTMLSLATMPGGGSHELRSNVAVALVLLSRGSPETTNITITTTRRSIVSTSSSSLSSSPAVSVVPSASTGPASFPELPVPPSTSGNDGTYSGGAGGGGGGEAKRRGYKTSWGTRGDTTPTSNGHERHAVESRSVAGVRSGTSASKVESADDEEQQQQQQQQKQQQQQHHQQQQKQQQQEVEVVSVREWLGGSLGGGFALDSSLLKSVLALLKPRNTRRSAVYFLRAVDTLLALPSNDHGGGGGDGDDPVTSFFPQQQRRQQTLSQKGGGGKEGHWRWAEVEAATNFLRAQQRKGDFSSGDAACDDGDDEDVTVLVCSPAAAARGGGVRGGGVVGGVRMSCPSLSVLRRASPFIHSVVLQARTPPLPPASSQEVLPVAGGALTTEGVLLNFGAVRPPPPQQQGNHGQQPREEQGLGALAGSSSSSSSRVDSRESRSSPWNPEGFGSKVNRLGGEWGLDPETGKRLAVLRGSYRVWEEVMAHVSSAAATTEAAAAVTSAGGGEEEGTLLQNWNRPAAAAAAARSDEAPSEIPAFSDRAHMYSLEALVQLLSLSVRYGLHGLASAYSSALSDDPRHLCPPSSSPLLSKNNGQRSTRRRRRRRRSGDDAQGARAAVAVLAGATSAPCFHLAVRAFRVLLDHLDDSPPPPPSGLLLRDEGERSLPQTGGEQQLQEQQQQRSSSASAQNGSSAGCSGSGGGVEEDEEGGDNFEAGGNGGGWVADSGEDESWVPHAATALQEFLVAVFDEPTRN